jgi:hypothetical protein
VLIDFRAMKKLAIGCGLVLVLVGVAVAGASYYVYRQARSMFAQLQELDRVPEIERGVRTRSAYVPPESNEITTPQVEKLVKVQALVRQRLGQRFTELEVQYKALMDKKDATVVDLPALLGAYRDVAGAWMEAKRSQVDALNAVDLSLDEYKWIREQCYRALGAPYMDFDVAKIVEQIRGGATTMNNPPGQIRGSIGPTGPEANRKIIEPFKKQLEDNLPLASFGL